MISRKQHVEESDMVNKLQVQAWMEVPNFTQRDVPWLLFEQFGQIGHGKLCLLVCMPPPGYKIHMTTPVDVVVRPSYFATVSIF
jgi:hypothetical protein